MYNPTEYKTNQNRGLLMIQTPLLCPCSVIEMSLHPVLFIISTEIYIEIPGMISSVHRIFQARVLEWGAIAFSKNKAWQVPKILSEEIIANIMDLAF